MSLQSKIASSPLPAIILDGSPVTAAVSGAASAIKVLLVDASGGVLLATGTDVPIDTSSGYAKGCLFIDTDAATGTTGLYENIGTNTSSSFNAIGAVTAGEIALAEGNVLLGNAEGVATALNAKGDTKILVGNGTTITSVALSQDLTITNAGVVTIAKINNLATAAEINSVCDGNTATAAEIVQSSDISIQNSKMVPAAPITSAAAAVKQSVIKHGDIIETIIFIDLTDLKSIATLGDIIGDTGVSYIGQITAAINGTIFAGEIGCSEVPVTGDDDIDLYSATENTGAYDGDIASLVETALVDAGGAHAIGTIKPFTALPIADEYLYLTSGNGDTAGTYTAGQIYIKLLGYV